MQQPSITTHPPGDRPALMSDFAAMIPSSVPSRLTPEPTTVLKQRLTRKSSTRTRQFRRKRMWQRNGKQVNTEPDGAHFSYRELIDYFFLNVAPTFANPQSAVNYLSTLSGFREFHCVAHDACIVGPELDGNFNCALSQYIEHRAIAGKSDQILANDKSRMRKWWETYEQLRRRDHDRGILARLNTAWETLAYYVNKANEKNGNVNIRSLSREAGLRSYFISLAIQHKSRYFTSPTKASLEKLEAVLETPAGALTRFLQENSSKSGDLSEGLDQAPQEDCQEDSESKHLLRLREFNPLLREDWTRFYQNKTYSSPPDDLKRNKIWRLRPLGENPTPRQKDLSDDGATYAPTAGVVLGLVRMFFGALRELGLDPSLFRFAYLADNALLEIASVHIEKRLGGFTESLSTLYGFTTGLSLHVKEAGYVGFIVQQPEYVNALPTQAELAKVISNAAQLRRVFHDDREEDSPAVERPSPQQFQALTAKEQMTMWRTWCTHNRKLMLNRRHQVEVDGQLLEETRDRRAIQTYLDWSEPIAVLTNMARAIRKAADEERYTLRRFEYLTLERTYLFVEIEINQPLRIENMAHLTYDSNNKGNLYRRYDAEGNFVCWAIKLEVSDFKNWRTLAKKKKKYDIPLPEKLNDVINRWVDELLREYGYRGKGRFYVFPMIRGWYKVDLDGKPLLGPDGKRIPKDTFPCGKPSLQSLGDAFRQATIDYVPDCAESGFGPHACRHIVATHIVKNVTRMDPFLAASLVLHDEVETVRNEYGHLRANDGSNAHQEQLDAFYEVYYAAENDDKKQAQQLSSLEAENARLQAELVILRQQLNGGSK